MPQSRHFVKIIFSVPFQLFAYVGYRQWFLAELRAVIRDIILWYTDEAPGFTQAVYTA